MIQDGMNVQDTPIRSFLMIGQSNMAGRGEFSDVPKIENKNCFMLRMGRWQTMHEPINTDRWIFEGDFHSGVSLAASFADEASRTLNAKIGLIPCADGGTSICQWMPGEILYDHAVMMARLAMRTSTLAGILWHQGENDCTRDDLLYAHKERFIEMITALRAELGAPELPLLIGELAEHISERWGLGDRPAVMNQKYREIAAELPHCALVSSKGLSQKPDGLHFDSKGLRVFGKRYFEAYQSLLKEHDSRE
ncbi:MAG: sialate O-acetylesterase [Clostridia bacterium]|nr:sialate O-acetylesterase [Clostridia bacterium]